MLWKAARWLMGVGLIIVGGRSVPEPSSTLEQPWREVIPWPWLQANWVALACFVLAAVLLSYSPIKWWIDRQNAKDLRQRVRTNLIPGQFDETDAADALNYLLRESAWGHREYARLNHWGIVNGFHLREFARAAERGDIVTLGWSGGQGRTLVIDRRYWRGPHRGKHFNHPRRRYDGNSRPRQQDHFFTACSRHGRSEASLASRHAVSAGLGSNVGMAQANVLVRLNTQQFVGRATAAPTNKGPQVELSLRFLAPFLGLATGAVATVRTTRLKASPS